jgi:hypothetical protein
MEAALDALFVPERLEAIARLVTSPRPELPPRVSVSTLANQFYCEMQVHLARSHTLRTESAELAAGAAGTPPSRPRPRRSRPRRSAVAITAGEPLELVEMPLSAEVHGVRVVGRADRIHLDGSARAAGAGVQVQLGRRELFPSHVVQVEAYGRMLEADGFPPTVWCTPWPCSRGAAR